jgi:glucose 1-dehydrogenase
LDGIGHTTDIKEGAMNELDGRVAIVTGGSSGIGQAIAIRLRQEGVNIAINYVGRPRGAVETRDAIEGGVDFCMNAMRAAGARPMLVEADVSDESAVDRMFKEVLAEHGDLDYLVNNAGIQTAASSRRWCSR